VLARTFLEPLGPTFRRPWDTVSTTLVELLHAWSFDAAFRRRGYVQHRTRDMSACDLDLLTISSQVCDEYVVIRKKAQILSSTPLVQAEPGGDVVVARSDILVACHKSARRVVSNWNRSSATDEKCLPLPADYWPSLVGVLCGDLRAAIAPCRVRRRQARSRRTNRNSTSSRSIERSSGAIGRLRVVRFGGRSGDFSHRRGHCEILEVMRARKVGVTYRRCPAENVGSSSLKTPRGTHSGYESLYMATWQHWRSAHAGGARLTVDGAIVGTAITCRRSK
jgi:hypothetical protein